MQNIVRFQRRFGHFRIAIYNHVDRCVGVLAWGFMLVCYSNSIERTILRYAWNRRIYGWTPARLMVPTLMAGCNNDWRTVRPFPRRNINITLKESGVWVKLVPSRSCVDWRSSYISQALRLVLGSTPFCTSGPFAATRTNTLLYFRLLTAIVYGAANVRSSPESICAKTPRGKSSLKYYEYCYHLYQLVALRRSISRSFVKLTTVVIAMSSYVGNNIVSIVSIQYLIFYFVS